MPVDPPGPASSEGTDPTAPDGPSATARTAKVKAGRAAGPKRTPRPVAGRSPRAGTGAGTTGSEQDATAPAATVVADRPDATEASPLAVDDEATAAGPGPSASTVGGTPLVRSTGPRPAAVEPTPGVRRGRRVKRVVRRIDLWSVLKLSLVVYTCLYLAVLAALAVLWGLLYETNTIDKVTSFLSDVGLENFHFYGDQMFRACAAIGAVGVMAGTVITVLATALVNVISEITGGIRLVVIEEDVQG